MPQLLSTISIAASLAMLAGHAVALTVTPIASEVGIEAYAETDGVDISFGTSDSQAGTTNPLSAGTTVTAGILGGSSVTTSIDVGATWASAASGQVIYDDVGWVSTGVTNGAAALTGGLDFSYTFSVDVASILTVDWSTALTPETTDPFGLNGLSFREASGAFAGASLGIDSSDSFVRDLAPGTYEIIFSNSANISGFLGTDIALFDAQIDWQITSEVPLPPALALFATAIAGLGMVRTARRR